MGAPSWKERRAAPRCGDRRGDGSWLEGQRGISRNDRGEPASWGESRWEGSWGEERREEGLLEGWEVRVSGGGREGADSCNDDVPPFW